MIVDAYAAKWGTDLLLSFDLITQEQFDENEGQWEHEIAHGNALMDQAKIEWKKLPWWKRLWHSSITWKQKWVKAHDTWEII